MAEAFGSRHYPQGQRGCDRQRRIVWLTAPRRPWLGPLGRDHLFGQPHRQAAALAQRSIIFGPVSIRCCCFGMW